MNKQLRNAIKPLIPGFILRPLRRNHDKRMVVEWRKNGSPAPPPHLVKQDTIAEYQRRYGYRILIETGTYLGAMVDAQKKRFDKIVSIELGDQLYTDAVQKFAEYDHIEIVHGDSGKVLPDVLMSVSEPTIFWLDGHYSAGITAKGDKECPIYEELDAIFDSRIEQCILLIDDARCFNGTNEYPTIDALKEYLQTKTDSFTFEVKDDIIRVII